MATRDEKAASSAGEWARGQAKARYLDQSERGLTRIGFSSTTWTDRRGRAWTIRFEWGDVAGRAECVGLTIENPSGADTWRPIGAELLRRLPIGSIVEDARRKMAADAAGAAPAFTGKAKKMLERHAERFSAGRGRALDPATLAAVADVYATAWRAGEHPVQAVAREFTISVSAAAKRVMAARRAGHLPPTRPGVAFDPTKEQNR